MKTTTTAPPPYSAEKTYMHAGTVYACSVCGAAVVLPADNQLPAGAKLYYHDGQVTVFCSAHAGTANVMHADLHQRQSITGEAIVAAAIMILIPIALVAYVLSVGVR